MMDVLLFIASSSDTRSVGVASASARTMIDSF